MNLRGHLKLLKFHSLSFLATGHRNILSLISSSWNIILRWIISTSSLEGAAWNKNLSFLSLLYRHILIICCRPAMNLHFSFVKPLCQWSSLLVWYQVNPRLSVIWADRQSSVHLMEGLIFSMSLIQFDCNTVDHNEAKVPGRIKGVLSYQSQCSHSPAERENLHRLSFFFLTDYINSVCFKGFCV